MEALLSDNGTEFVGTEMKELKEMLNVVEMTTGVESPWQNGLCEKNHATIDNILERLDEDFPEMDLETKLAWANLAKNTMKNVYGFSPNQLVFGRNPNLPVVETTGLPAWEKVEPNGESLRRHLKALNRARIAFVKAEAATKVKKALLAKVRTVSEDLDQGDIVFYRRDRDGEWKGPAKVIFQDNKVVFIRHGGSVVKVSINRVVKRGMEVPKWGDVTPVETSQHGNSVGEGPECSQADEVERSSILEFDPEVPDMEPEPEPQLVKDTQQVETEGFMDLTSGEVEEEVVNSDWKDQKGRINIARGTWISFLQGGEEKIVKSHWPRKSQRWKQELSECGGYEW